MCDAANVAAGDVVFEIGPGTGALTRVLLERGARVVALETDARAITSLQNTFPSEVNGGQLTIHHGDARHLDLASYGLLSGSYKTVANIPYYLSGLLFRQCLETAVQPTDLVFLAQREVAERIARDPKGSILSYAIRVFGEPAYICTVKRGHFTPPPAVDSAIIAVRAISNAALRGVPAAAYFSFLHTAFAGKRKQLVRNLAATVERDVLVSTLHKLELSPTVRAEDIPFTQFIHLFHHLYTDDSRG